MVPVCSIVHNTAQYRMFRNRMQVGDQQFIVVLSCILLMVDRGSCLRWMQSAVFHLVPTSRARSVIDKDKQWRSNSLITVRLVFEVHSCEIMSWLLCFGTVTSFILVGIFIKWHIANDNKLKACIYQQNNSKVKD